MAKIQRVSHSFLDPFIGPRIKAVYPYLRIPAWYPPEGIIGIGHVLAILGGIGFAYSTEYWWGGLLIAIGALGNHFADCIDGTHARATGQCRNGGELLDHFTDPLSFSYWVVGWSISCGSWALGFAGLICIYATAVLTSIKAKMIGEFTVSSFGPTEFKLLLAAYGFAHLIFPGTWRQDGTADWIALWLLGCMVVIGVVQLVLNLIWSVKEVNTRGAAPDTSAWITRDQRRVARPLPQRRAATTESQHGAAR